MIILVTMLLGSPMPGPSYDVIWYDPPAHTISHSQAVTPLPRVTGHLPRSAQRQARIDNARYSRKAVAPGAAAGGQNMQAGQQGNQGGGQGGGFRLGNISQLFGTIDDRRVGEMPNPIALLGGNR